MFAEGSIGKVRYAGLAYMLQEDPDVKMDLQQNAPAFFESPEVGEFLERKYPEQGAKLQSAIVGLFSGDAAAATLADLTTHRSGIGDATRDQARLTQEKGVEHQFTIPELLLIPDEARTIPKGENGRLKFQTNPKLPDSEYGAHQYSNLGYMLLGLAMEASWDAAKNPAKDKEIKDYKQLTNDYMLHPIEGRAAGKGLSFDQTKFSVEATDDVARSSWLEAGRLADCTKFSGANAAGGMFASADDSTKFFNEFFKGFPDTPTWGEENVNPFLSDDAIAAMMAEGLKFGNCGRNGNPNTPRNGNERFQAPGFAFEVDQGTGKMCAFEKSGGTFGGASFLAFDVESGQTKIDMCAQENVTAEIATLVGVDIKNMVAAYSDEAGNFNRHAMIAEKMPEILEKTPAPEISQDEVTLALNAVFEALKDNGAAAGDSADNAKIPNQTSFEKGGGRL